MGTVENLRNHRKRKAREAREKQADDNRVLFGLTKVEKARTSARNTREESLLDGKKRDGRGPETVQETPPDA